MSNELRKEVLRCFKTLHQARKFVFREDDRALTEGRKKINEEFKKQKHVENIDSIKELINYSQAVEHELRTCVIQAKETGPGKFQAEITKDTVKLDNKLFNEESCKHAKEKKPRPNGGCS